MLRLAHAWVWVAIWVYALGRGTQSFPVSPVSALVLGALLAPGVYWPLRLMQRERDADLSGDLSAPLAVAVAGVFVSFVVLGSLSFLGFWDIRPAHATAFNVALAVLLLHGLGALCIALSEHWLLSRRAESH